MIQLMMFFSGRIIKFIKNQTEHGTNRLSNRSNAQALYTEEN